VKNSCTPARSVVNLCLYCVGSGKWFRKSYTHTPYVEYMNSVTHSQAHGVTSNTYCNLKYIHCNLFPTDAQGLFAHPSI